jgi:hypothetical protein
MVTGGSPSQRPAPLSKRPTCCVSVAPKMSPEKNPGGTGKFVQVPACQEAGRPWLPNARPGTTAQISDRGPRLGSWRWYNVQSLPPAAGRGTDSKQIAKAKCRRCRLINTNIQRHRQPRQINLAVILAAVYPLVLGPMGGSPYHVKQVRGRSRSCERDPRATKRSRHKSRLDHGQPAANF